MRRLDPSLWHRSIQHQTSRLPVGVRVRVLAMHGCIRHTCMHACLLALQPDHVQPPASHRTIAVCRKSGPYQVLQCDHSPGTQWDPDTRQQGMLRRFTCRAAPKLCRDRRCGAR